MALVPGTIEHVVADGTTQAIRGFKDDVTDEFVAEHIVTASGDLDPIFDDANAKKKAAVTAAVTLFTPPAGCKFARIVSTGDCFIRTDNTNPSDADGSTFILARTPEVIPVTEAVNVKVFAAASCTVYVTPLKARPS